MKSSTSFLFFFLVTLNLSAQNLVPNPSFEELNENQGRGDVTINCSKDWFASTMMATDYYNRKPGIWKSVPKNQLGYQDPHTGNAYAGICVDKKYIEYLQVQMLDTLIAGKKYLVEFYISRAEKTLGSLNELGILFTDKGTKKLSLNGIAVQPRIKFSSTSGYRNKKKWPKLSAVYEAKGNESCLILGYFTYAHPYKKRYCHYYIDDVSVTLLEKEIVPAIQPTAKDTVIKTTEEKPASITKAEAPEPGKVITLKNIFFATNKSELMPASFPELDQLVNSLNSSSYLRIQLSGHTDNLGSEEANKLLSESRAKAVSEYLILKGIDKSRVSYAGYGSKMPVANNNTEEGRQQNRRVDFIINMTEN